MNSTTVLRRILVATLLCLIVSLSALAQQGVGAIGGSVTDTSGAVLPGVTVTLGSAGVIGANQTAVTDERGTYQFSRLVPGTYSVKAELTGFQTAIQENISVNADRTSRADLKLAVGQLSEQMTITAEAPLLDTTTAAKQVVMAREVIDALPGRNDIYSIARMAPAVTINKYDVGGASALQSSAAIHGSVSAENGYMIDGIDVSNPCCAGGGSSAGRFDAFMFQEINYQLGNTPAELPVGGVLYNMVTKTGTNVWHFAFTYSGAPPSWASDNISPSFRTQLLAAVPASILANNPSLRPNVDITKMYDTAANLSGPIKKDRLWFAFSIKKNYLDQNQLGSYNADGTQVPDANDGGNKSFKISWQVDSATQAHFTYIRNKSAQLYRRSGTGLAASDFIDTKTTTAGNTQPRLYQGRVTRVLSSKLVADASGGYMKSATGGPPQDGVNQGDIARYDAVTRTATVASGYYVTQPSARFNMIASLSYASGTHDFKAGYYYNHGWFNNAAFSLSNYPAGFRAVYRNGVPDSVNTYNTPVEYDEYFHENSVYAQDRWKPTRKLTLNIGVRFQTTTGWEPAVCQTATIFIAGRCFDEITGLMEWKNFGPRLSAVYDMNGDGRTALKFSANRYYPVPGVPFVDLVNPIKIVSDTRPWSVCAAGQTSGCDLNGDKIPQINEFGASTGFNLGTTNRFADDIKSPNVNEYTAGIEQQLPWSSVVSASFTYRTSKNQIGPTNLAVPLASYTPITAFEPSSGRTVTVYNQDAATRGRFDVVYDNASVLDNSFKGVDFAFTKRMNHRWMAFGGLALGKSDGDIYATFNGTGGDLNNPNLINRRGVIGQDIPVTVKASGSYEFPYGIAASASYQYFSGFAEQTTVSVGSTATANGQPLRLTQVTQALVVETAGTTRLPGVHSTDIGLRKAFNTNRLKIEPTFDVFNLANLATVTSRVTQLGPTYQRPNAILRGRVIRIGVNVDY